MVDLKVEIEPDEAGFDAERLARIDRHFAALRRRRTAPRVADRRQPAGPDRPSRDVRSARRGGRAAGRARHAVPHLLDDEAGHVGGGDDALRGGRVRAEGPGQPVHPVVRATPGCTAPGRPSHPVTEPAIEPMRIWHLLTHTAGLTYGFHHAHPVDAMYRAAGFEWGSPPGVDLAGCCDAWATLPLLFQPGSEWNYSVATDVLGRVVEVVSGQSLDEFFAERIFDPLGMSDTGFWVDDADHDRLAALYVPHSGTRTSVAGRRHGRRRATAPGEPVRRWRPGVDRRRLPPLHPDAARRRRSSTGPGC